MRSAAGRPRRRREARARAIAPSIRDDRSSARRFRRLAVRWLPPVITDALRLAAAARKQAGPEWEYLHDGWPEADSTFRGWDVDSVVATQVSRWPSFVRSVAAPRPFGSSNEAEASANGDYGVHNTVMSFAYVLARAARERERVSILDWGGGIGHYCVYARSLLPEVELDYHCRELARLASAGRQVLPDQTFHDSDETALARRYDLVLASSSLQYSEDWRRVLAGLARVASPYLYVTRTPFISDAPSFVVVQRPHRHGYLTEYAGWFLNRHEFLSECAGLGLRLEREFLIDERPYVEGAPEQAGYRGFLLRTTSGSVEP